MASAPSWKSFLPSILLFSAAGIVLGLGLFTFGYARGGSYFSNDPAACINCHIMREQFDAWQHSSHHTATCNDCHVPANFLGKYWTKAEHGFWHSKGFTFQDFHEPIQIKSRSLAVVEANCVRCHTTQAESIGVHDAPEPGGCVRCHSAVGHALLR